MAIVEKIPKPSEGSYARTTHRMFPKLSATAVQAFMEENRADVEREASSKAPGETRKRVPEGARPSELTELFTLQTLWATKQGSACASPG